MVKKRSGVAAGGSASRPDAVEVTSEERRHLIEDVAFFRAEHYRHVEAGRVREDDRAAAQTDIDMVLKRHGG